MALPATPTMLGGDDQAKQEYFAALQKTLSALEARANKGPNWFEIAGSLLDPGRTGNVGEALGRTATVMGKQQEKQQEAQMPIAQMRAQIAGQKYEVENQSKAIKLLSDALAMPPEAVTQGLASGALPPAAASKITPGLYAAVSQLSPKVGEVVKTLFGMNKDITGMNLDQSKFNAEEKQRGITNAAADRAAGASQAELLAKYGPDILALMPGGGMPMTPAAPPSAPPVAPAAPTMPMGPAPAAPAMPMGPAPAAQPPMSMQPPVGEAQQQPLTNIGNAMPSTEEMRLILNDINTTGNKAPVLNFQQPAPAAPPAAPPVAAKPVSDLAGMPLAAQVDVGRERQKALDTEFKDKRATVFTFDPQTVATSTRDLRELFQIADKSPQIFGIMQREGFLSALGNAAQEGVTVGRFGNVSLPIKTMVEKYKLSEDEQRDLSIANKILARQFFENAKNNKQILGPQISNSDVMLLKSPTLTDADSAQAIKYWVKQNVLGNKQKDDLYKGLTTHDAQFGTRASPGAFFSSPQSPFIEISRRYNQLFEQLTRDHSPVFSTPTR